MAIHLVFFLLLCKLQLRNMLKERLCVLNLEFSRYVPVLKLLDLQLWKLFLDEKQLATKME